MARKQIKLLIADDHRILIDGLENMLANIPEIKVVCTAENGKEVLEQMKSCNIDVILMDIQMPVMDGYEAAMQVVANYPSTKVIILSMHSERVYIERMFDTGISGYLLKNTGKDEIIEAIRRVYAGEKYFSREVTASMFSKQTAKSTNITTFELTKREREILGYIASGKSNPQIAESLYLSEATVKTHRKNMMRKLGVNNTAGLVKYALENDIEQPDSVQ
jgi:DNA-binding NarL/FixJ family response regulator